MTEVSAVNCVQFTYLHAGYFWCKSHKYQNILTWKVASCLGHYAKQIYVQESQLKRRPLAILLMRHVIACSQSKVYKWLYPRRSESSKRMTDFYTCRTRKFWPLAYQIPHTETYNEEHLFTVYTDLDKTTAGNSKIWPPEPPTLNTGGQENRRWLIKLHTMHVQFDKAIYKFLTVSMLRLCVHFIDIVTSAIYWAG